MRGGDSRKSTTMHAYYGLSTHLPRRETLKISFHASKQIYQAKDIAATTLPNERETGCHGRNVELIVKGAQRRLLPN